MDIYMNIITVQLPDQHTGKCDEDSLTKDVVIGDSFDVSAYNRINKEIQSVLKKLGLPPNTPVKVSRR